MINEIIKKRRSIRRFDPSGAVSNEQIELILEAAMLAPSACNCRPWNFIVVKNRQKLNEIATFHPYAQMLKTAQVAIVVAADPNAHNGKAGEGMWQHDCGAATQNILLQATSMGLGSCWCGVHPVAEIMAKVKELFSIPENMIPFCVVAIGVPATNFGGRGFYDENKVQFID